MRSRGLTPLEKLKFFRISILGKIRQENVFDDILEIKNLV